MAPTSLLNSPRKERSPFGHCCGLPQRFAACQTQRRERTDVRERLQLVVAQLGTNSDVIDRSKRQRRPRNLEPLASLLAQPSDVSQPETKSRRGASPNPITP
jgi:hypothetical protein